MKSKAIGPIVYSFFNDYLKTDRGLRASSISTYRDGLRLYLTFLASSSRRKITNLRIEDMTKKSALDFLRFLEDQRHNQVRTRNNRLAILRVFFEYLARRSPEAVVEAEKVALIPTKRTPVPGTHSLERHELEAVFAGFSLNSEISERDYTLILFLYNTGARAQEVADLRIAHLDFRVPRVRLHGKGDKWRECPLWKRTAEHLQRLIEYGRTTQNGDQAVFVSQRGTPLTRFGIYKIIRRRLGHLDDPDDTQGRPRRASPHLLRHTTAHHLVEAGVELNVIRGWLGHVKLETTNRYAEINRRTKEEALRSCDILGSCKDLPRRPPWHNDDSLLKWLNSL